MAEIGFVDETKAERISLLAESTKRDEDKTILFYRNSQNVFEPISPEVQIGDCSAAGGKFDAIVVDIASNGAKKDPQLHHFIGPGSIA